MKNVFSKFQEYVKKPKRNVFDLTFANNLTTKFGQLTPVFCKEVIPGDSFKIHSKFGLEFMPMKFPVQTPIKAYLHFFYVRNRTIWKDWMDFIGGTKDNLVVPYVTPIDKERFFRVGGLADYLGVPNVIYGNYGVDEEFDTEVTLLSNGDASVDLSVPSWVSSDGVGNGKLGKWGIFNLTYPFVPVGLPIINPIIAPFKSGNTANVTFWTPESIVNNATGVLQVVLPASDYLNSVTPAPSGYSDVCALQVLAQVDSPYHTSEFSFEITRKFLDVSYSGFVQRGLNWQTNSVPTYVIAYNSSSFACRVLSDVVKTILDDEDGLNVMKFEGVIPDDLLSSMGADTTYLICQPSQSAYYFVNQTTDAQEVYLLDLLRNINVKVIRHTVVDGGLTIYSDEVPTSPYDSDIHLNALPFRAYEAIYNAYYRNPQNNPFILDGTPEYNRYVTTFEGGADTTQYDLFQRNWEFDFLTSAVQSPQQGIAPLVGISVTGEATFQDEEGNNYYAQAIMNDDGEITGWQSHSPNMPQGSLRLLMDMAGTGISINDLRNVNAFQRFLENNIRHGLKYRDQLMSHFGVKARYDELDMPEFIGGVSTQVDVYKISQTSESGSTPMGSFVGQGNALAESRHDITHYCDEHGFIIGILSVVPIPVYSQLLPKFFMKSAQLDYYFPEFGHIGYQPILQKEVSPLQTFYAGDNLNAVFGYNRAWYDYLASTDEVHSQFRTTMRDFIMNRTFDVAPELSESFLLVDPAQLNDVFLAGIDDDIYAPESDKIIGSMRFEVTAKRPIPLFGIPKLEG